jgi:hypothetical protein
MLIALPDRSKRVLKLFAPLPPGAVRDAIKLEAAAYATLYRHGVTNVPRCHGAVEMTNLRRQIRGIDNWDNSEFDREFNNSFYGSSKNRKEHIPLRGLLIDFIPDATTLMAAPERLLAKPSLVDDVLAVLDQIHKAGVLHRDYLPRNVLLDKDDRVWWIDFGCAYTTGYSKYFPPHLLDLEQEGVRRLLQDDVVPAAREGRVAEWRMIGA